MAPLSFDEVFQQCAPFVWRVLRRLGGRDDDLKDLSQEVFLVVHRKLDTFDSRAAVQTWIYGICLRVAADYRRRAYRRREVPSVDLPERGQPAQQDHDLELRQSLAWLDAVLDSLDDAKREVFVLFDVEQRPIAEVAEIVGCPIATAYTRLYAARRQVEAAARREQAKRSSR